MHNMASTKNMSNRSRTYLLEITGLDVSGNESFIGSSVFQVESRRESYSTLIHCRAGNLSP